MLPGSQKAIPADTRKAEVQSFAKALAPTEKAFERLDTNMSYTEVFYSKKRTELLVHIWLMPQVPLRWYWERLATSFGPKSLAWTAEATKIHPPHFLRGSIFIGLHSTPMQAHNAVVRLLEIDKAAVTLRSI